MKVAIPSASMLCLEWWSLEVLALMAGYINVVTTASFVIIINTFCVLGMFSFGSGIAASVCVGKAIGEGNADKAIKYAKLITLMSFIMMTIISLILYSTREYVIILFTNSDVLKDVLNIAYKLLSITLILHGLGLV